VLAADGTATAQLSSLNGGALSGARNRIINGDMRIDQRNAGASVTATSGVEFTLDRWKVFFSQNSKYTIQRNAGSVTPPAGFTNYLGVTSLSAYAVTSTDYNFVNQTIEGFSASDLAWGSAFAQTVTLSFWVRSSLTGTFSGSIRGGGGTTRSYVFAYTINAANTWEYKTVTIPGATVGTWTTDNLGWGSLTFCIGSGSTRLGTAGSWQTADLDGATGTTSVVGTNGATFYITGAQLEPGSVATPFERRSYGQELELCQRYYQAASNFIYATSFARICYMFPTQMRAAPTLTGGGSGFSSSNVTGAGYCADQTSAATQSMTFSAEL